MARATKNHLWREPQNSARGASYVEPSLTMTTPQSQILNPQNSSDQLRELLDSNVAARARSRSPPAPREPSQVFAMPLRRRSDPAIASPATPQRRRSHPAVESPAGSGSPLACPELSQTSGTLPLALSQRDMSPSQSTVTSTPLPALAGTSIGFNFV